MFKGNWDCYSEYIQESVKAKLKKNPLWKHWHINVCVTCNKKWKGTVPADLEGAACRFRDQSWDLERFLRRVTRTLLMIQAPRSGQSAVFWMSRPGGKGPLPHMGVAPLQSCSSRPTAGLCHLESNIWSCSQELPHSVIFGWRTRYAFYCMGEFLCCCLVKVSLPEG